MPRFGEETAALGGPTKGVKKLVGYVRVPAEICERPGSGRSLNILGQSHFSFASVSSGLKCCGLFCDLNLTLHLRTTARSSEGEIFRSGGKDLPNVPFAPR